MPFTSGDSAKEPLSFLPRDGALRATPPGEQQHVLGSILPLSFLLGLSKCQPLQVAPAAGSPARAPRLWEHRVLPGPLEIVTAAASLEQRVERKLEQKANAFSRTLLELP